MFNVKVLIEIKEKMCTVCWDKNELWRNEVEKPTEAWCSAWAGERRPMVPGLCSRCWREEGYKATYNLKGPKRLCKSCAYHFCLPDENLD